MSASAHASCFHASASLMGMVKLHFVCDLPPIWEHTGTRVILGEYVDCLSERRELRSGKSWWIHSPLLKLADGNRSTRLCVPSEFSGNANRGFTDQLLAQRTQWCSRSHSKSGFRRSFLLCSGNFGRRSYPPYPGLSTRNVNLCHPTTRDGVRFEGLTFSRRTEEHNGVILPKPVFPKPGEILRVVKRYIVTGGS